MGNCVYCALETEISIVLQESFAENLIEKVQFRQWVSVDRCNLKILEKSSEEFIDLFCSKLSSLVRHDFLTKQQEAFLNYIKENLKESEFTITCDFSQNYSIVLQDEAQSYHWISQQITIHPFVIYFKRKNKIEHVNYVVVSDCLEYNTIAVYTLKKKNSFKKGVKNILSDIQISKTSKQDFFFRRVCRLIQK